MTETTNAPVERWMELADRCETAVEPSLDLDADICRAVYPDFVLPMSARCAPSHIGSIVPRYGESLDAAMSLVPEFCWAEGTLASPAAMEVHSASLYDLIGQGHAATPALALTAACLRARAAIARAQEASQ